MNFYLLCSIGFFFFGHLTLQLFCAAVAAATATTCLHTHTTNRLFFFSYFFVQTKFDSVLDLDVN